MPAKIQKKSDPNIQSHSRQDSNACVTNSTSEEITDSSPNSKGGASLSKMIQRDFPPERITAEIERLLTSRTKKFNQRGEEIDDAPDIGAITAGLKFALDHGYGLPVRRIEQITAEVTLERLSEIREKAEGSHAMELAIRSLAKRKGLVLVAEDVPAPVVTDSDASRES